MAEKCSVESCDRMAITRGWCSNHYQRWKKFGRLDRVKHSNKGKKCLTEGCENGATTKGYCSLHYRVIARKNPELARSNKRYSLWHERKSQNLLCPEWLDFFVFIEAIGERPGRGYSLLRKDQNALYGPDNFRWVEVLRRRKGESRKDWYARKWQSRKEANPGWGRRRDMHRKYGITIAEYDEILASQKGVCAICRCSETRIDPKTGNLCNMSVDHCHKSGSVRELLCSRCNTTIGRVNESVELLRSMIAYLERHNEPKEQTA